MALEDPLHPYKILSQIDLLLSPSLGFLGSISNYEAHHTSLFSRVASKAGTLKISSLPRITVSQEIQMPHLADHKLG